MRQMFLLMIMWCYVHLYVPHLETDESDVQKLSWTKKNLKHQAAQLQETKVHAKCGPYNWSLRFPRFHEN